MYNKDKIILYIDIDGTITNEPFQDYNKYFESTPNQIVIKKVNYYYDKGYTIIFYTSRFQEDNLVTKEWLKKHNVKFHNIIFGKPRGTYFIDDKNLSILEFLNKEI